MLVRLGLSLVDTLARQPFADGPFWFCALVSKPIAQFARRKLSEADLATRQHNGLLVQPSNLINRMTFTASKDISHTVEYGAGTESGAIRPGQFSPSFGHPSRVIENNQRRCFFS